VIGKRRSATVAAAIGVASMLLAGSPGAAVAGPPTARQIADATEAFLAGQPRAPVLLDGSGGSGGETAGGEGVLPGARVVAFYGAPQMSQTVLGSSKPRAAARALATQSAPYAELGARPVIGEFDLVAAFATAGPGADGLYRSRQSDDVISIYLAQARAAGARLMLDIQPGRSTFSAEIRALRLWLQEPDVDIALDPEWNVGPRGIPGQTKGSISRQELNGAIRKLARIVDDNSLPAKLIVVHQFRRHSIVGRSKIKPKPGVQTVLNFDGIGSPGPKSAGFSALATTGLFNGFSLFYLRDTPLMSPAAVLGLTPEPDFLLYQ
jgi:hypothetical protein